MKRISKSFILQVFIYTALLLQLSSCKLFQISLDSGTEPLSKQDLNTRLAVRSYYSQFAQKVIQTSDSIVLSSSDNEVAINALLWKINATASAAKAAYQTIPEAALVDVWALTYQMSDFMRSEIADSLFGAQIVLARNAGEALKKSADQMGRSISKRERFEKLQSFVKAYAQKNRISDLNFVRGNVLPELTAYLGIPDSSYVSSIGSAPEVMSDLTERIGIVNEQIQNQLEWQKQLLSLQWEGDSIADKVFARTDSLTVIMNRLVVLARESPELLGGVAERMREELEPMLINLGMQMNSSIAQLSRQREELQIFVDEQRAKLAKDINKTTEQVIAAATESLVEIIRNLIVYFILLILVLFGLPFGLGYSFGRMRLRKKQSDNNKNI